MKIFDKLILRRRPNEKALTAAAGLGGGMEPGSRADEKAQIIKGDSIYGKGKMFATQEGHDKAKNDYIKRNHPPKQLSDIIAKVRRSIGSVSGTADTDGESQPEKSEVEKLRDSGTI